MKKIVLTLAVILMMTTSALADTTGACGQNATWALNEATEILTISGTGPLYDCGANNVGVTAFSTYFNGDLSQNRLIASEFRGIPFS